MKNSLLFTLILLTAILGGAGLFYLESKLPDNELITRDINTQLLKIDNLNASINELALRSRANLDANYDMLVRSTLALERTIVDLSDGHFNPGKISGSLLETRFNSFRNAVEIKTDQIEDFKSHNSVLRNSEKYAPIVGNQLAVIAERSELAPLADMYRRAVIDVLEFTKQGSDKPISEVENYAQQISATEEQMPEASVTRIIEFSNHVATAIDAKQKTDQYLGQVLNSTVGDQVEEIFNAWSVWQAENNNAQTVLQNYMIGYVAVILGLIGILVFRLRSLYTNLDKEVEIKTEEVKSAYKELQESERQLVQNEKMASLGQLVAGVAHEINTPLSYISSNVETVKSKLSKLSPVLEKAEAISTTVADPKRDKNALNALLREQIMAVRQVGGNGQPEKISALLTDASEGINEIEEIVKSLTSFSHVQDAPTQEVDIHERLDAAIQQCDRAIGDRKIELELDQYLPMVKGVPNQLIQVFKNVLINAAHATDNATGVISIETRDVNGVVEINISDNGTGIDQQALKRVLDPFFTTKEVGEGTGLGLSIAHQIVKAHQGKIAVDSEVNAGTTVTIQLPAVTVQHIRGEQVAAH